MVGVPSSCARADLQSVHCFVVVTTYTYVRF